MRCKKCDYPLWQIRDRKCPECGEPFLPSDYEFIPNSVRFCCPHCEQAYYGTAEKGHLSPRTFACVSCAQLIDMDQMVLLPAEGVQDEQTEMDRQPWLERGKRRSFLIAWFATIGHSMVKPGRLMRATVPNQGAADATWFMVFTQLVIALVSIVPLLLFVGIMATVGAAGAGGGGRGPGPLFMLGPFGFMALFFLAVWLVGMLLTTLCAHGILKITGGCAYGIGRTWQSMCYSSGANVATCVPCLGMYFGWIWWLVSACVALKDGQRVHGGRATLAVLTFPILGIGTFVGLYIWFIVSMVGAIGPGGTMSSSTIGTSGYPSGMDQARISSISAEMLASTDPLRHAGELLVDDRIQPTDLIGVGGDRSARLAAIRIGGRALVSFETADEGTKSRAVEREIASIPTRAVAYRIGDTVFTHLGMDLKDPKVRASSLWIVVGSPESPGTVGGSEFTVSCANGSTRSFHQSMLPGEMTTQNRLRRSFGLPPLPAPQHVGSTPAMPASSDWGDPAQSGGDNAPTDTTDKP